MLKFIKQMFISSLVFLGSLSSANPLECISMKIKNVK